MVAKSNIYVKCFKRLLIDKNKENILEHLITPIIQQLSVINEKLFSIIMNANANIDKYENEILLSLKKITHK